MKSDEAILIRQKHQTRFENKDMDFNFNWLIGVGEVIGLSTSQIFYAVKDMKGDNPKDWRENFTRLARSEEARAESLISKDNYLAGVSYLSAGQAYRAVLHYINPKRVEYLERVKDMEESFIKGIGALEIPLSAIEIPFEDTYLPAYYIEQKNKHCPTLIMVGGGDTYREDLFYFAGFPGWKRGYNVLMVDLPGQGKLPSQGQTFRVDMEKPISTAINWLEENAQYKPEKLAIYGVSGGGYFTGLAVAHDTRIKAWIASTPITDVAKVFQKEFGNALKAPSFSIRLATKLIGSLNESAQISLDKYAWQLGTDDFKEAVNEVYRQALPVQTKNINIPSLFLVGESEGEELIQQTEDLCTELKNKGIDVKLIRFTEEEGADAHCQVNNLRLAHHIVYNWLDDVFNL